MKMLLPILMLALLSGCTKRTLDYSCICTYADGKVYDDHDYAKGWKKDVKQYCEGDLGSYTSSIGVTCKMYDSNDDFYRCLTIEKNVDDIPGVADTAYFFTNVTEATIDQFKAKYTYMETLPDNKLREHYAVCSKEWGALY